jgi:hypothetical protein
MRVREPDTRPRTIFVIIGYNKHWLQEEPDEHGQGKWEEKQKGKSDKRNNYKKHDKDVDITIFGCHNTNDEIMHISII